MKPKYEEINVYAAVSAGDMEIDAEGRIWRVAKRGWNKEQKRAVSSPCARVRAENPLQSGYLQVRAMFNLRRFNALAHRLVWLHLHGPVPVGMVVNHINANKSDNRPCNLEIVTPIENVRHQNNPNTRLSESDVLTIRERRATGEILTSIAEDFSISMQHVSEIARGKHWADV